MLCSWALKIDNVALAECTSIKAVGTAGQVTPISCDQKIFGPCRAAEYFLSGHGSCLTNHTI